MSRRIVSKRVISLADSERINGFLSQKGAEDFEVFDAFDGRNGGGEEFFNVNMAQQVEGRTLTGGEIGCAISHIKVISEFAESVGADSDLMLVAEDDARFHPKFLVVLNRIVMSRRKLDYVVLAEAWGGKDFGSWISPFSNPTSSRGNMSFLFVPVGTQMNPFSYRLGHVRNYVWGAGLYLVSRSAARRIVGTLDEIGRSHWTSDSYHYWAPKAKVDLLVCRPQLATWEGESQISGRQYDSPEQAHSVSSSLVAKVKKRIGLRTRLARVRGTLHATKHELEGGSFPYLDKNYTG